ncbi:Uncharacterised protein [Listeria grayi]|uniref:hypothetical protein n=1 Tax=Listeria grayi TaxID=1641 RepID=UPI000F6EFB0C|nr:hypothetical protein [Listeria grayi]VEI30650.1 Uncharacterised protein [Listeria grayi]
MFLKETTINEYIKKLDLKPQTCSAIWGTMMPSKISSALLGSAAVLNLKYNVIYFTKKEIIIIPIDNLTGEIIEEPPAIIDKVKVQSVIFKKKLLGYVLRILTEEDEIRFKVNSKMIGAKWHSLNMERILKEET